MSQLFGESVFLVALVIACPSLVFAGFFTQPGRGYAFTLLLLWIALIGRLIFGANDRGVQDAKRMARGGTLPSGVVAVLNDVEQVKPTWVTTAAVPSHYRGEDLLDLGSANDTVIRTGRLTAWLWQA